MAILRGGKRIGGYDIRIGLPRDRSLDDVQSDPRLRQKVVHNFLKLLWVDFRRWLMRLKVFQRKARFYVNFTLPKGVDNIGIGLEFANGQVAK